MKTIFEDPSYRIEQQDDDLYCCVDGGLTNTYLLLSSETAILVDTGYGFSDYREKIGELCEGRKLITVLTHGHPDHGLGSYLFEEVFLGAEDIPVLEASDSRETKKMSLAMRMKLIPGFERYIDPEQYLSSSLKDTKLSPLKEGDRISLEDREIEVLSTPGHSKGSLCFLDRRKRRIFTGDLVTHANLWNISEDCSLKELKDSYLKLLSLEGTYDRLYPAHGEYPLSVKDVREWLELLEDLKANHGKDNPFTHPMAELHSPGIRKYTHQYGNAILRYTKEQLNELL